MSNRNSKIRELTPNELCQIEGGAADVKWYYLDDEDPLSKIRTPRSAIAAALMVEHKIENLLD